MKISLSLLCCVFLLMLTNISSGQGLIIPYSEDFEFNSGVYLSFDEFKDNMPSVISYEVVMFMTSDEKGESEEARFKYIKHIEFQDEQEKTSKLKLNGFWGLCENNQVYVNNLEYLFPLKKIGAIMYVEMEDLDGSGMHYSTGWSAGAPGVAKDKFIIDFESGLSFEYSTKSFEALLEKDKELLMQFKEIGGKKKRFKQIPSFIDKYNVRHPIGFPVLPFKNVNNVE